MDAFFWGGDIIGRIWHHAWPLIVILLLCGGAAALVDHYMPSAQAMRQTGRRSRGGLHF
jgi:hypothetical protein